MSYLYDENDENVESTVEIQRFARALYRKLKEAKRKHNDRTDFPHDFIAGYQQGLAEAREILEMMTEPVRLRLVPSEES